MLTNRGARLPTDGVSAMALRHLAVAMEAGQLACPLSGFALSRIAPCPQALTEVLVRLSAEGMSAAHMALLLHTAADVGEAGLTGAGCTELVWTGPEPAVSHSRDTATVVEELFNSATRSVLVSTFAIQGGSRLFAALAARFDALAELSVRLFVHVARDRKDTRDESEILREFGARLTNEWPGRRRPEVFYDPRGVSADGSTRASWHAKCVIVDNDVAFITSANFTEWAQQRNVEAGVLVREAQFAQQLCAQFDALVAVKAVRRVPGF